MSEYAEIKNNKVINVVIIDDTWSEDKAQEFLATISSNLWVKTTNKVGKAYEYHPDIKVIAPRKPFSSWELDVNRGIWLPPVAKPIAIPIGYLIYWSEQAGRWLIRKIKDE